MVDPELLAAYQETLAVDQALLLKRAKIDDMLFRQRNAPVRPMLTATTALTQVAEMLGEVPDSPLGEVAALLGEQKPSDVEEAKHAETMVYKSPAVIDELERRKQAMLPDLNRSGVAKVDAKFAMLNDLQDTMAKQYMAAVEQFQHDWSLMGVLMKAIDRTQLDAHINPAQFSNIDILGSRRGPLKQKSVIRNHDPILMAGKDIARGWARSATIFMDQLFPENIEG
ncbi:MAG: hypothetical protein V7708_02795 [Oceanicoccus sp.]